MRSWCIVLVLASACGTTTGSFRFSDPGMRQAFENWKRTATPKTRSTINALDEDPSLLIHVIRGRIERPSRGGATVYAGSKLAHHQCIFHPAAPGVRWNRNFDVVYDEEQQRRMSVERNLPTPVEAILQHEIMGHVVPLLLDPAIANLPIDQSELQAVRQENEYRRHIGLVPIPERTESEVP
jgi:hypothetical protein